MIGGTRVRKKLCMGKARNIVNKDSTKGEG